MEKSISHSPVLTWGTGPQASSPRGLQPQNIRLMVPTLFPLMLTFPPGPESSPACGCHPNPSLLLPACTQAQVGTWYFSPLLQQKRCSQLARHRVSCWLSTSVCSSSAGQDARQQQDLWGGRFMKQTRGPWDGFCGSLNKAWGGHSTATWKGLSSTEAAFCCSCGHSFLGKCT